MRACGRMGPPCSPMSGMHGRARGAAARAGPAQGASRAQACLGSPSLPCKARGMLEPLHRAHKTRSRASWRVTLPPRPQAAQRTTPHSARLCHIMGRPMWGLTTGGAPTSGQHAAMRKSARAHAPGTFMVGCARDCELLLRRGYSADGYSCRFKVIRNLQRLLVAGPLGSRRPAGRGGKRAWASLRGGQRGLECNSSKVMKL
jgi:hypothetical protein